nr:MAG TPA: hypothetical protein [Caudoviricetes sp.]
MSSEFFSSAKRTQSFFATSFLYFLILVFYF